MDKITFYAPITKKDSDQRIVAGFASTEAVDSQGEIVKTEAIERALPEYMKFGNIREMHRWSAVGKTLAAKIDKNKKGLFVKGKIVDNEAWEKIKEGVYNGFSIGGKVLKKVNNIIHELTLNEISLVDRPANPEAVYSLVKIKKGGEVVEKQLPVAPTAMEEEIKYPGIRIADQLISMAHNLSYMVEACQSIKRPTKHIEKAIKYLKEAAMKELQSEGQKIADQVADTKKKDLEKVEQLKTVLKESFGNRIEDPSWSEGYFEQLVEVL